MKRITLAVPVYNEEITIRERIGKVDAFLATRPYASAVLLVLSDNASTDGTASCCHELVRANRVTTAYCHVPTRGKGAAIREAWSRFPAEQYWYMDLDLSTDLAALDELHHLLRNAPIVIGSRLLPESRVTRRLGREVTSRTYNFLLRRLFQAPFRDAQCGFKGVTEEIVRAVLPLTRENGYFFDSELLLIAAWNGYPIRELPVTWIQGPRSHVSVRRATPYFFAAMWRYHQRRRREPYSLRTTAT